MLVIGEPSTFFFRTSLLWKVWEPTVVSMLHLIEVDKTCAKSLEKLTSRCRKVMMYRLCIFTGMSWKITMLVLSSLALVLGTVILIFNVYSNRWVSTRQRKELWLEVNHLTLSQIFHPGEPEGKRWCVFWSRTLQS